MHRLMVFLLPLLGVVLVVDALQYNPCNGPSPLDGGCRDSGDCEGVGVHCARGVCKCVEQYTRVTTKEGRVSTSVCEKLPNREKATCHANGQCAPPLTCQRGKCKCLARGTTDIDESGQCITDRAYNATCAAHTDCTRPFMACVGRRCQCVKGTRVDVHGKCNAKLHCPFGGRTGKKCQRFSDERKDFENLLNAKIEDYRLDDCDEGEYCVTPASSSLGHCCTATCPMNTEPIGFSCRNCDTESNFCHVISGNTFAYSLCCPRPCKGHASVYVEGKCTTPAALGDLCSGDGQCRMGEGMKCTRGRCACETGFVPKVDNRLSSSLNVPQQCERKCKTGEWVREGECYRKAALLAQCFIQEQCPSHAGCYRGRCMCKCGYDQVRGRCVVVVQPSTPRPATTKNPLSALTNLLSGAGGNGNSGGGLTSLLGGLGKGGGGTSGLLSSFGSLLGGAKGKRR